MKIREKFGTAWISKGSGGSRSGQDSDRQDSDRPGALEGRTTEAFLTLGKQMVRILNETNGVDRLDNVAKKMMLEAGDLDPVVEWLARNYYVRVSPDKFGNHEIRLASRAKELLGELSA